MTTNPRVCCLIVLPMLTACSSRHGAAAVRVPPGVVGNLVSSAGYYDPGGSFADAEFSFQDLGHRCIDFGARENWHTGAPVYVNSCNGTGAQHVRVKEIDSTHDVELRVLALFCIGVRGGRVAIGQALELQPCSGSPAQRFALDGDSILMGAQASGRVTRDFAIETDHRVTANRTPLVVADRDVSDAEYFRYAAVGGSTMKPTSGFFVVSNEAALDWALQFGWGTVIELDDRQSIVLTKTPKVVHGGVTLRGYRKQTYQGPEVSTCVAPEGGRAVLINEDSVRITGFRLRGQMDANCPGDLGGDSSAIHVDVDAFAPTSRTWVDRLDIGYWHGHAVDVSGPASLDPANRDQCSDITQFPRTINLRVVDNFVHHNLNYGIVTGQGAFVLDEGNVMYRQGAHSIAADPVNQTGYHAFDNLILQETRVHDIDMHGSHEYASDHDCPCWEGGVAGDYFDVGWNTVLADQHVNVDLRGTPCRFVAIHDNVFRQSQGDVIENHSTKPIVFWNNQWPAAADPMSDLAVGDFDGDGLDDVFVGTGAAWYYSSGGQAEWRFLNRMPEHASQVRIGDFDGDGRADVMALHGALVDVSWGGLSPWQTINVTAWPISEIAVGDFDGDRVSDLFLSTGAEWFFAPGGRNWAPFASSSLHAADLRFGDFTNVGHTQVLNVDTNHKWAIVTSPGQGWVVQGDAGANSTIGLVVGRFESDPFADLARFLNGRWEFASPGRFGWKPLLAPSIWPLVGSAIGRFDADATSDVILWSGRDLYYSAGAKTAPVQLSRQDMR